MCGLTVRGDGRGDYDGEALRPDEGRVGDDSELSAYKSDGSSW